MPSSRRVKAIALLALLTTVLLFYISTAAQQTRASPFYTSTVDALTLREMEEAAEGHALDSADDLAVQARLRDAEEQAKKAAARKAQAFHGEDVKSEGERILAQGKGTGEDGVAKKESVREAAERVLKDTSAAAPTGEAEKKKTEEKQVAAKESAAEHKAHLELDYILKRSPIIIFSKTYCPFSKKAKDILLNRYKITPVPYVVELDEHEIGKDLQTQLASTTGRSTVPNVLVNGKSIGGGDDIEELHTAGKLQEKITSLAGKKVQILLKGAKMPA